MSSIESTILDTVAILGSCAMVTQVIDAVEAAYPRDCAAVRAAYWQLVADNRLVRYPDGHLATTKTDSPQCFNNSCYSWVEHVHDFVYEDIL